MPGLGAVLDGTVMEARTHKENKPTQGKPKPRQEQITTARQENAVDRAGIKEIPRLERSGGKMDFVVSGCKPNNVSNIGAKAAALAFMQGRGFLIPPWFSLSAEALRASLTDSQRILLERLLERDGLCADDLPALELAAKDLLPSPAVEVQLKAALSVLCPNNELVAVRSSAADEDGILHSFAGQMDSFLFVPPDKVAARVADVWRSAFSQRILAYREQHGLSLSFELPCVLIQKMIDAEVSGVAFSADPVSGDRDMAVIAAVYGLGHGLVAGEIDADSYHVDRHGNLAQAQITEKTYAYRFDAPAKEGLARVEVPESLSLQPALSKEQAGQVAQMARQAEAACGTAQDIEWAMADGQFYLLQVRPITSLKRLPCGNQLAASSHQLPDSNCPRVFDNSNISESYNGVTTPLTFSFARSAYEHVYRQFCRLMRVPEYKIAENADIFPYMIALLHGRLYYNLRNWVRLLSLFPGYRLNRRFMEQMMGVKESLPEENLASAHNQGFFARLKDGLALLCTLSGLAFNYLRLNADIKRFNSRLDAALQISPEHLRSMSTDELIEHYLDLQRQLLTRWDAPLTNDFFAMIFYGLLSKLTIAWCGDKDGTLQNALLVCNGGIISLEPARQINEMAALAASSEEFTWALCNAGLPWIERLMSDQKEFARAYRSYLLRFGDRCLDELKLESQTLTDDPLLLLRAIGQSSRRLMDRAHPGATECRTARGATEAQKQEAESQVSMSLKHDIFKHALFRIVLHAARARVCNRENLRFERTRIFGRVRRIFVEIGRRFQDIDVLDSETDIFYLEVDEILSFVNGTATTVNLRKLTALRKEEFTRFKLMTEPPARLETRGVVYSNNFSAAWKAQGQKPTTLSQDSDLDNACSSCRPKELANGNLASTCAHGTTGNEKTAPELILKGTGCCPGIVRGRVRVILDPRNAILEEGEILVARRTDPGWIMLFPAASGLLVEHGSLLSHSAIVARELGLPAIVSIASVTDLLKDGDLVELDGKSGIVRLIHTSCRASTLLAGAKRQ